MKSVLKFMLASTLIVSGLLIGSTLFTVKGIDKAGNKLQDKLYN